MNAHTLRIRNLQYATFMSDNLNSFCAICVLIDTLAGRLEFEEQ